MAVLQPSDKLTLQHETEVLAVQQMCKSCGKLGHQRPHCIVGHGQIVQCKEFMLTMQK